MRGPSDREKATIQMDRPSVLVERQGFTDSPNLFGQVLEQVLEEFALPSQMNLLQCVDDLLLSGLPRKR
jgi:hypothetical protein